MQRMRGMKRDCDTSRMSRIDLYTLLDASSAPDRQMVTIRMPKLVQERVQDLNAVPEAVTLADGTPADPIDVSSEITRPIPPAIPPAMTHAITPARAGLGDVTLIGVICSLAMSVCGALAWL
jgi:hypothetical protein